MATDVRVSQREIDRIIAALNFSKQAALRASGRALRATAQQTRAETARTLQRELRVAQKVVRSRLRLYRTGELEQKVWLGINGVAARRLGMPRRERTGTKVGNHFFDRAFPIWRYGGGVYRRTGRSRFPLEMARLEIAAPAERALRAAAARAETWVRDYLTREMERELAALARKGVK